MNVRHSSKNSESRHILITGMSGMIGGALKRELEAAGYQVHGLQRTTTTEPQAKGFYYSSEQGVVQLAPDIPLYGVINLAGPSIADKRWSERRKEIICESRVKLTSALCEALAQTANPPKVLLSASAIGYYGAAPAGVADESSAAGDDFLASVATRWEAATQAAQDAGIRTLLMRLGVVLSSSGGVIGNFILPMKAAVVGRAGPGFQHISWVSLLDVCRFVLQALEDDSYSGAVNLVAPHRVSNDELSRSLAKAVGRFRLPPLPSPVLRLMFGEMADAILLADAQIASSRLAELGFKLHYPELDSALHALFEQQR